MVVTVNGRAIDITLEQERTLGELLAGVERWLEESGFSVSGLTLDSERVGLDAMEAAYGRNLEGIARIDIDASSWIDLLREALAETARALEDRLRSPTEALTVTAAWNASASASFLAAHDRELQTLIVRALEGTTTDIAAAAATIKERIREIDEPRAELQTLAAMLEPTAARLEELPLDLQTGKDTSAATTLVDFTSRATKLFRLVPLLRSRGIILDETFVDDNAFRPYIEELGTALKELISAYEGGDAVLVGDLAEYELAPRLRSLAAALERVLAVVA
jgi:hypothetical protein